LLDSPFDYGECHVTVFRLINGTPHSWSHNHISIGNIQLKWFNNYGWVNKASLTKTVSMLVCYHKCQNMGINSTTKQKLSQVQFQSPKNLRKNFVKCGTEDTKDYMQQQVTY